MGDFNTTLRLDPPYVSSHDARASSNIHTDRDLLQQLLRTQDLIALHCKHQYASIVVHGLHHSRIDRIFVRQYQVQFKCIQPTLDCHFMRNFGIIGSYHHPLFFVLPRWYAPRKSMYPLNNIDIFAIRTARLENTPKWQQFEARARQCIASHATAQQQSEVFMHTLESDIRTICIHFFPKSKLRFPMVPHIPSLSARMWQARKQAMIIRGRSIRDLFNCWAHLTTFHRLHKMVRKQSRQNKRDKLQQILSEGADLAFNGRTFDWYRKIRFLCPKQQTGGIQLFDNHGLPLNPSQEVQSIEQYYSELFADPTFPVLRQPHLIDSLSIARMCSLSFCICPVRKRWRRTDFQHWSGSTSPTILLIHSCTSLVRSCSNHP